VTVIDKNSFQTATRFTIEEDDLVVIDGRRTRCVGKWEDGVVLRALSPRDAKPKAAKSEVLTRFLLLGRLEVHKGYFGVKGAIERARQTKGFELEPETTLRARMVSEFVAQECSDDNFEERAHRSDDDIERFYAIFKAENPELVEEARLSLAAKGKTKLFVGPRQFRRLINRYLDGQLHPTALMDRRAGRSGSGSKFTREELEFHLRFADEYRTPQQKTMKQCWIEMKLENLKRVTAGKEAIRLPSLSTFQRLIKDGNDFLNEAMRSTNKERVLRKFDFKRKGLQPDHPLQIIEMDEHEFDVKALLTKNKLWDYLHPEAQVRLEGLGRVHMSVALDAFSRSICGMKIVKGAPSASSAIATLAMVARPKNKLAALAGSKCGWPQCGTPDGVHTDAGAGYVAAQFELAVMLFTGNHRIPPSKHPHLRGRVERFFRTINQRYVHMFPGRTFSNVLLRDEYDSDRYARLTDEEIADLLVCLIVDCYHNTKHRSLGMTPLEMWERGSQLAKGSIQPPPNEALYREIFGSTAIAKIGNEGIVLFGNNYSSPKLLEIQKKWFGSSLIVRINEENISTISVKHRILNHWINVPAVHGGLEGTSLEQWKETVRFIKNNIGHQDEYSEKVVLEGLQAAMDVIERTERRPGAILHEDPGERLRKFQKEIGSFRWDQSRARDYGHEREVIEQADDLEPEFLRDIDYEDFEDVDFGAQEPLPSNGLMDRQKLDRHWDSVGVNPYVHDGSEYDTTRFVSAEDRLLPPDKRGGSDRAPKPRNTKAKAPDPAAGTFTVMAETPPETPGPEIPEPPADPARPYGFKARRSRGQK